MSPATPSTPYRLLGVYRQLTLISCAPLAVPRGMSRRPECVVPGQLGLTGWQALSVDRTEIALFGKPWRTRLITSLGQCARPFRSSIELTEIVNGAA